MTERDNDILVQILKYCNGVKNDIERFGNTFEIFDSDPAFKNSISMYLMQIGELSNKLSKEFRESTAKEVPWEKMYGMRNHVAHGYGDMSFDVVWETAFYDIPKLREFCETNIHE